MATATKCGFYANDSEVFFVNPAGSVWLVASPDMTVEAEDVGELPADATPIDHLLLPEEIADHFRRIELMGGEAY